MDKGLFFTSGFPDGSVTDLARACGSGRSIEKRDLYDVNEIELAAFAVLLIGMHVDQRFLSQHSDRLHRYLRKGGTIVANGQFAYPVLEGVSPFQPLRSYRLEDLTIHRETAHSIWEDVAARDLTFRKGVAGFYGRGWHDMPADATLINSIGPERRPVDFTYRVGAGRVLVHGGNDLWQFGHGGETTRALVPRLLDWMFAREKSR